MTYTVEKCATGNSNKYLVFCKRSIIKFDQFLCPDVCSLRMDFESMTLLGPASTAEPDNGHNCQDTFKVTVSYLICFVSRLSNSQSFSSSRADLDLPLPSFVVSTRVLTVSKSLSSIETTLHPIFNHLVYMDMGNSASDTAKIEFAFSSTSSTIRTWEIKLTQIPCNSPSR